MSDDSKDLAELGRLITLLSEDNISAEELHQLETRLLNDPAAQDFYRRYVALDVDLAWNYTDEPVSLTVAPGTGTGGLGGSQPNIPVLPVHGRPGRAGETSGGQAVRFSLFRARWKPMAAVLAAAGVLFALVLGIGGPKQQEPGPSRLPATVAEVSGSVDLVAPSGMVTPAVAGQVIPPNHTLQVTGEDSFAVVTYARGSRLELKSDARVRFTPWEDAALAGRGIRVYLSSGMLQGEVAPEDHAALVLATPQAEFTAASLGSRFLAWAGDDTYVEVENGSVHLVRLADGNTLDVQAGNRTEAGPQLAPLASRPMPRKLTQPRRVLRFAGTPLAVSRGGGLLVTVQKPPTGPKPPLHLLDTASGRPARDLSQSKDTLSAAISADGAWLATGAVNGVIRLHDLLHPGEPAILAHLEGRVSAITFSADGRSLVAGLHVAGARKHPPSKRDAAVVYLFAVGKADPPRVFKGKGISISALAISPNGQLLAAGTDQSEIVLWEIASGKERYRLPPNPGLPAPVHALAFSPDGRWLARAAKHVVALLDVNGAAPARSLPLEGREFRSLAFSPSGATLAGGSTTGSACLWNANSGQTRLLIECGRRPVDVLTFSRDGSSLLTGTRQVAQFWAVPAE